MAGAFQSYWMRVYTGSISEVSELREQQHTAEVVPTSSAALFLRIRCRRFDKDGPQFFKHWTKRLEVSGLAGSTNVFSELHLP
jgi:hypothetical protein